jgi:hypothetical protein
MTFSISALVSARDSHIKRDSEAGGLIPGTIWKMSCHNLFITYSQGLLWLPKSRSQKNRQVPVLKVRSQFRNHLNFYKEPIFLSRIWMIACTTASFMYKWSRFVCTNVNVCIVLLFFISISSSKTKDLYNLLQYTVFYGLSGIQPGFWDH